MAKKTALYERHVELGARIVDFAGWMLPVQYPTGPKEEHVRVRTAAGLFDIDHMGQIAVSGPDALRFLQRVLTADISRVEVGASGYALLCYDDGTIIDDVFVYRLPDQYLLAVNASNNEKDTRWLEYQRGGLDVDVRNVSEETYMLALQGPQAEAILQEMTAADLSALPHHHITEAEVVGVRSLVSRTGYTGEDGFELYFSAGSAAAIWDALLRAGTPRGLIPAGLAARDTLRLEAAMPLYGQEISASINPIEARMGWAVALDKEDLIGRDALLKVRLEGPTRTLVGFRMTEGGVARHGYPIATPDGQVVGEVTSGSYAPTLNTFIGLGFVPVALAKPGTEICIDIRGKLRPAAVVRLPFYKPRYRR